MMPYLWQEDNKAFLFTTRREEEEEPEWRVDRKRTNSTERQKEKPEADH
jgi:hypothetical protein